MSVPMDPHSYKDYPMPRISQEEEGRILQQLMAGQADFDDLMRLVREIGIFRAELAALEEEDLKLERALALIAEMAGDAETTTPPHE